MHAPGSRDRIFDPHLVDIKALGVGDEGAGAHDIQGGNTEEAVRVVDASGLEDLDPAPASMRLCISGMEDTDSDLGGDRDGGVDGVGDDEKAGLRAGLGGVLDEVGHDARCNTARQEFLS